MRTINIGFSKSRKKLPIFSWLIRWYQGTEYSHVFMEIDHKSRYGANTIFHSNGDSGVSYYSKPIFLQNNEITDLYQWNMSETAYYKVRRTTHSHLGYKYGYWQNIGVVVVDIFRYFGFNIKNPWKKGYNCSESIFQAIIVDYPELESKYDINTIKPIEIQNIVEELQFYKLL